MNVFGMQVRFRRISRCCVKIAIIAAAVCLCACVGEDLSRGNAALKIGDYDRAVTNFSKVLDEVPSDRDARYGLALAYYAIAEEHERVHVPTVELWERTVREFKILARVDSSGKIAGAYSSSLFYLARASLEANPRSKVLPLLDLSIQLDSLNFFSYNLKALLLAKRGEVAAAKDIFVYILAKDPKFVSAYVNLGSQYWQEGDVESAWDIWSMGLRENPKDPTLIRWTAVAEDSLKAMVLSGQL